MIRVIQLLFAGCGNPKRIASLILLIMHFHQKFFTVKLIEKTADGGFTDAHLLMEEKRGDRILSQGDPKKEVDFLGGSQRMFCGFADVMTGKKSYGAQLFHGNPPVGIDGGSGWMKRSGMVHGELLFCHIVYFVNYMGKEKIVCLTG